MPLRNIRLAALVAAGVLFAALVGATLRAQTPDSLLQQAEAALGKNDYAAAAQALETYLAKSPDDYRAEFNLAYAYSLLDRRSDAILLYRKVLEQEEELLVAHLNLGILLVEENQPADALEHLRKVVAPQPENFRAQSYLAQALAALNRLPQAREAFEAALRLQPDDAPTHLAYARLVAPTDPASAEEHLRKVLASAGPQPCSTGQEACRYLEEAQLLLATALENRAADAANVPDPSRDREEAGSPNAAEVAADPLTEAAAIYRRYLQTHPERADLHRRLGQIYVQQKLPAVAIAEFEAARAAGDETSELAQELLQTYLQTLESNRDKALALVRELLERDANDADLHFLYGTLWMGKKEYAQAAAAFRRVTDLKPQGVQGYTNLASALYLLKDDAGTVAALASVTQLGADTAGTYFLRAITMDRMRDQRGALENYEKFLARDEGKNADQEFQARQRIKVLERELRGRRRR